MNARIWYHRPEWISALIAAAVLILGSVGALSQGAAQTAQNTKDIADLRQQVSTVPERLSRIEQKVDDLTTLEKRRRGQGD